MWVSVHACAARSRCDLKDVRKKDKNRNTHKLTQVQLKMHDFIFIYCFENLIDFCFELEMEEYEVNLSQRYTLLFTSFEYSALLLLVRRYAGCC